MTQMQMKRCVRCGLLKPYREFASGALICNRCLQFWVDRLTSEQKTMLPVRWDPETGRNYLRGEGR